MHPKLIIKTMLAIAATVLVFNTSPAQAEAEDGCVWRRNYNRIGFGSVCESGEKLADDSRCGKDERPNESNNMIPECCCQNLNTTTASEPPKFIMPELQVKIPGLQLSPTSSIVTGTNDDGSYSVSIPWIAEYIKSYYDYGLGVAGILAALVLMGGGILWLISGGDASKITQAKEMIIGSTAGLTILASSYIILTQINPELTRFKAISLGGISRDSFEIPEEDKGVAPSSADGTHGVPWYFQCSEEGNKIIFGDDCNPNKTICEAGCGVVSTMMVINKLGGSAGMTALAKKVVDNGGRTCGNGSNINGLIKAANTYGFKGQHISWGEVEKKLDDGHSVIMSVNGKDGNCPFTKGGHYIVLTGWQDKTKKIASVNDPANRNKNSNRKSISLNTLEGCKFTSAFYLYK